MRWLKYRIMGFILFLNGNANTWQGRAHVPARLPRLFATQSRAAARGPKGLATRRKPRPYVVVLSVALGATPQLFTLHSSLILIRRA